MKIIYIDDFGLRSKVREATKEEMDKMNHELEQAGLEEFGMWHPYQPGFECPEETTRLEA